jgi:5-methylcytosine-specific restriction endonuclease McrA
VKKCSNCAEEKPFEDFYNRAMAYDGKQSRCKVCQNELTKSYAERNREKTREYTRKWRKQNKEYASGWAKANPESIRKAHKKWVSKNKHKRAATEAKRRASLLKSTPTWLDDSHLEDIQGIYCLANKLGVLTEEPMEVDHIVPLQGENVCGLHVPWNLQVLHQKINRRKNNRYNDWNN